MLCALVVLLAPAAFGQSVWNGSGGNGLWSNDGNWSVPLGGNGFTTGLTFAGATNLSTTNDLTSGTATVVAFDATAGAFTLAGNALTLSGSIVNGSSGILQTLSLPLVLTSNTHAVTASSGTLAISGNVSGGPADGITALNFSGGVSTLMLSGSNSYTGNTRVT